MFCSYLPVDSLLPIAEHIQIIKARTPRTRVRTITQQYFTAYMSTVHYQPVNPILPISEHILIDEVLMPRICVQTTKPGRIPADSNPFRPTYQASRVWIGGTETGLPQVIAFGAYATCY